MAAGRRASVHSPSGRMRSAGSLGRAGADDAPRVMAACRPPCPKVSPRPPTGRCPRPRSTGSARGRSGSTCTCRSARCGAATATSTPTPRPSSATCPGASRASYADAAIAEIRLARAGARRRGPAGRHGLLRRRHADPAAAATTWSGSSAAIRRRVRARGRRRGDHRVQPGQRRRRRPGRGCARAGSTGSRSACSRRCRTCCGCSTAPTTRAGCRRSCDWARAAGFEQVSLDLIYGTPGESLDDWRASLDAALACEPDHVSAYALIVEEGTALARQVRRGEVPMPDDDDLADKYLLADEALAAAGLRLVRGVQLGARRPSRAAGTTCGYWTGGDWWGVGPGAHSHVGGVRWWNVKHPTPYAGRIGRRGQPGRTRARCSTRRPGGSSGCCSRPGCATGCRSTCSTPRAGPRCPIGGARAGRRRRGGAGRVVLTPRGRLLADAVVRDLLTLMKRMMRRVAVVLEVRDLDGWR